MHVVFPGSFDPPTYGHLHIIDRCSRIFSKVDVVIADNKSKTHFFSIDERRAILQKLLASYKNVRLFAWNSLIVDFLRERKTNVLVRGVRSASDYEYEFMLAQLNRGLGKKIHIETLFMPTDQKYFVLRSSVIKDIVALGGDVSDKVPKEVLVALKKKLQETGGTPTKKINRKTISKTGRTASSKPAKKTNSKSGAQK